MTDVYYVTSFRNLRVSQKITGHIELIPGVNITNDSGLRAKLLTPEFSRAAGAIEAEHLENSPNIVFGEFDESNMQGLPPDRFLVVILMWIDMLFKNAWLIKDHAMECDAAFLSVRVSRGVSWTTNYLSARSSFSDGYVEREIDMSISELQEWGRTNDLVESYLNEAASSSLRFMMEKGYARSGRAMQFVSAARRASDLAFKIANYCSALETLFTTESTELAHKLSERVAFFLGARGHNRQSVFAAIKNAYAVRSKLVHGDTLKPRQVEELPALSMVCDNYLRLILNEIFESESLKKVFDAHNQAIEDYFISLIFGPAEQSAHKS